MRILGVCGSPRRESTYYALDHALAAAREVGGIETELLELRGKKINPCIGCNRCVAENYRGCLVYHDDMDELFNKFFNYDAYLFASPVYYMGITPQLAGYFSRFRSVYLMQKEEPDAFLFKPAAALSVGGTRNGGQETCVAAIHGFCHGRGMPIVNGGLGIYGGACFWSRDKRGQGIQEDEQGLNNAAQLGRKLARLTLKLNGEF